MRGLIVIFAVVLTLFAVGHARVVQQGAPPNALTPIVLPQQPGQPQPNGNYTPIDYVVLTRYRLDEIDRAMSFTKELLDVHKNSLGVQNGIVKDQYKEFLKDALASTDLLKEGGLRLDKLHDDVKIIDQARSTLRAAFHMLGRNADGTRAPIQNSTGNHTTAQPLSSSVVGILNGGNPSFVETASETQTYESTGAANILGRTLVEMKSVFDRLEGSNLMLQHVVEKAIADIKVSTDDLSGSQRQLDGIYRRNEGMHKLLIQMQNQLRTELVRAKNSFLQLEDSADPTPITGASVLTNNNNNGTNVAATPSSNAPTTTTASTATTTTNVDTHTNSNGNQSISVSVTTTNITQQLNETQKAKIIQGLPPISPPSGIPFNQTGITDPTPPFRSPPHGEPMDPNRPSVFWKDMALFLNDTNSTVSHSILARMDWRAKLSSAHQSLIKEFKDCIEHLALVFNEANAQLDVLASTFGSILPTISQFTILEKDSTTPMDVKLLYRDDFAKLSQLQYKAAEINAFLHLKVQVQRRFNPTLKLYRGYRRTIRRSDSLLPVQADQIIDAYRKIGASNSNLLLELGPALQFLKKIRFPGQKK